MKFDITSEARELIKACTYLNQHTESIRRLAQAMGVKSEVKILICLEKLINAQGFICHDLKEFRCKTYNRLIERYESLNGVDDANEIRKLF